jgi:hypothetical protein
MSRPIPGVACQSVWRFTSSERGTDFPFYFPREQLLAQEIFIKQRSFKNLDIKAKSPTSK